MITPGAKSRTVGYEEECSPTLRAGVVPATVALENHPTDSRVKLSKDGNVQTLTSRMGTGGNNVPLVMKIRSGCEGGGKGALIQENKSATLSCNNDQTLLQDRVVAGTAGRFLRPLPSRMPEEISVCRTRTILPASFSPSGSPPRIPTP